MSLELKALFLAEIPWIILQIIYWLLIIGY
jgi:hypothetical protein